jgi:hypothetical protein
MTQPTPYVPAVNFADDERNNAGGRSTVRADRLDAELEAIEATTDGVLACLAAIQRDDGKLLDSLVEYYNLSAACKAALLGTKWSARGLWATATAYVVNDMVDVNGAAYICAVAHTSGVFATDYAAGNWQIFVTSNSAAGQSFTPTTTVTSTNTQAAIEEVDTKMRANSQPANSALFGGF